MEVVVINEIYDETIASYIIHDEYDECNADKEIEAIYKEVEDDGWHIRYDSYSRDTVYVYVERKEAWS